MSAASSRAASSAPGSPSRLACSLPRTTSSRIPERAASSVSSATRSRLGIAELDRHPGGGVEAVRVDPDVAVRHARGAAARLGEPVARELELAAGLVQQPVGTRSHSLPARVSQAAGQVVGRVEALSRRVRAPGHQLHLGEHDLGPRPEADPASGGHVRQAAPESGLRAPDVAAQQVNSAGERQRVRRDAPVAGLERALRALVGEPPSAAS